jgi:hypothetical protein
MSPSPRRDVGARARECHDQKSTQNPEYDDRALRDAPYEEGHDAHDTSKVEREGQTQCHEYEGTVVESAWVDGPQKIKGSDCHSCRHWDNQHQNQPLPAFSQYIVHYLTLQCLFMPVARLMRILLLLVGTSYIGPFWSCGEEPAREPRGSFARRQGIGTALVQEALDYVWSRGRGALAISPYAPN